MLYHWMKGLHRSLFSHSMMPPLSHAMLLPFPLWNTYYWYSDLLPRDLEDQTPSLPEYEESGEHMDICSLISM